MSNQKRTDNVIDVSKGPKNTLKIDDHNVDDNAIIQTIVWNLGPDLTKGDFTSFRWLAPPEDTAAFGVPEISFNGNMLTMTDNNNNTAVKNRNLAYEILVTLDGVIYTSRIPSPTKTPKDPIIINK